MSDGEEETTQVNYKLWCLLDDGTATYRIGNADRRILDARVGTEDCKLVVAPASVDGVSAEGLAELQRLYAAAGEK